MQHPRHRCVHGAGCNCIGHHAVLRKLDRHICRVGPMTTALEVPYPVRPTPTARIPATDAILMMRPQRSRIMRRAACWAHSRTPVTLMARWACQLSSGKSTKVSDRQENSAVRLLCGCVPMLVYQRSMRIQRSPNACRISLMLAGSFPTERITATASSTSCTLVFRAPNGASSSPTRM